MNDEASRIFGEQPDVRVPIFDDLQFLLRPIKIDNDETVQFAADTFVNKHFCVPPPKKKHTKQPFKGLADAIARQEHVGLQPTSVASKENNNCNKQQRDTVEDVNRRIIDTLRTSEGNESTKQLSDPTEIKAKELASLLKDGFEAYSLRQYALAATKYKLAWEMLMDVTLKLRLEHVEEDVICYMLCLSLLETDQLSNLSDAIELLVFLEKRCSQKLPAVYYALSKAHQKHCRYELALKSVEEGFAVLNSDAQITEYTIPGTDVTLEDSTRDGLSVSLAAMKDECSKWHPPDALCCASECIPTSRWYGPNRKIYFSDPAFSGMVVLTCSNSRFPCTMKFHQACWKLKKDQMSAVKKLSDKDIIGHECFTPNCEYGQGECSVISKVEVYEDDGTLKTHIEAPANPIVWAKRRPIPKGAIPKQPLKPKRHLEKTRRPVNVSVPTSRSHNKEFPDEDCLKRAEGLMKLAKLRQNNFGCKPDCEWRPDLAMYGNPQISEVVDFLGGPVFENDTSQVAAAKTFIFTYFYEFIKEIGCVLKKDILEKWEEDKYTICDNFNDALRDHTDIVDFLLQSYKLASIGAYIGIAENLPELYSLVRGEVCSYLRFSVTDPVRSSTTITQDDIYNTAISDFDEKLNKDRANVSARTAKMETTTNQAHGLAVPFSDSLPSEPEATESRENSSEATLTDSKEVNGTSDCQEAPSETVACSVPSFVEFKSGNDCVELGECVASPLLRDETLVSGDVAEPSDDVRSVSIPEEEKEGSESEADGASGALNHVKNQSQKTEAIYSEERLSSQESDIPVSSGHGNLDFDDRIEPSSDLNDGKCSRIDTPPNNGDSTDSDEIEPADEKISTEICTAQVKAMENTGIEKFEDPPKAQENSDANISKIDMTIMVQKFVAEFMNDKMVSQAGITEVTEDLKQLEERYAKLEAREKEITGQLETCQRELRKTSDENVVLKLEKTELTHKYEKLNEAKAEIQRKFDALLTENNTIKNQVLELQKERDRMYKKLEECPADIKEPIIRHSKQAESPETEEIESEQRPSEDVTKLIARKAKIESLDRVVLINSILLEKASEKCRDQIQMYKDVEKMLTAFNGRPFAMAEAIEAWQKTEYLLHHATMKYKADYLNIKALLESDQPIENLDDIKLYIPTIAFPQLHPLKDIYMGRVQPKLMLQPQRQQMPTAPPLPGARSQNQYAFPPPSHFSGQHIAEPSVRYAASIPKDRGSPRDSRADAVDRAQAEGISPRNDGFGARQAHQVEERRTSSDSINAETLDKKQRIAAKFEQSPPIAGNESGENKDHSIVRSLCDGASQISADRKSVSTRKIGTDSLVQKLKTKFEGVPELDLLESLQDLRKMHNDSLTGMHVEDIIRETEPLIKLRQKEHMAPYLPPEQSLPRERSVLPASKPSQRKIPPLIPSGQRKNRKGPSTTKQADYCAGNSFDLPSSSKKPAWGSVTSALIDWNKSYEDSECTICIEGINAYDAKNLVYTLPCQHSFHTACIKKWLTSNSICPICRIHCTMDDEFPPLPK